MHDVTVQGTTIPAVGFGTWQLEGDDCLEGVRHALELGYRHIDTAQMYGNEDLVGEGVRRSGIAREDVFLATKLGLDAVGSDQVPSATEDSLRALGTDYVDLLYIHWPPSDVAVGRTLAAMRRLVDDGTIRHIGVSNFTPSLLREAVAEAPVLANQVEYHPYLGQPTVLGIADEHDLLVTAYSPLARGAVNDDVTLAEIGEAHGKTPGQVALRWLVQQERVAAIPKSASADRRVENLAIFDFELTDDEMKRIFDLDAEHRIVDPPFAPAWER